MAPPIPRRDFVSTLALSGLALAAAPSILRGQSVPAKIKVALIGCGGRGTGALGQFIAACKILGAEAEVVALADAFEDRAKRLNDTYKLPATKVFVGYDAYQKVMATDCAFVLMATPPAFRPVHFAAAIAAGKHCFVEKPVAVDPVGARAIIATGEEAKKKGLAVVAGTQRRHDASYMKNKALIDAGAIGALRGGVVQWNGTVPWIRRRAKGDTDADYMNRNWLNFTELSGDHIVEQHIHNVDVAIWFLGRPPVSALGFGGRARRETGNMCGQKQVDIPAIKLDTDDSMVQEHVGLIRSAFNGKPLNDARQIAETNLAVILGRISAYTGEMVKFDDLLKHEKSPYYNLKASVSPLDFEKGTVKLPTEVPSIPGKS